MADDNQKETTESAEAPEAPEANDSVKKPKQVRPKAAKVLPTDRIAFPTQLDILRAYGVSGRSGEPVTNTVLAKMVDLSAATISLGNAFFADIGFIGRAENGFVPAQDLIAMASAYDFDTARAPKKLAPILERSWVWEAVRARSSFRPVDEKEVMALIAEAAGASGEHKPQIKMLLDYLEIAGLLERDGQQLKAAKLDRGPTESAPTPKPKDVPIEASIAGSSAVSATPNRGRGGIQFSFSIDLTVEDITAMEADQMTALLQGFATIMAAKKTLDSKKG